MGLPLLPQQPNPSLPLAWRQLGIDRLVHKWGSGARGPRPSSRNTGKWVCGWLAEEANVWYLR